MDPWYKIVTPRKEVREGRSFNPDEFAIALEQVVAGKAPEDYRARISCASPMRFRRATRARVRESGCLMLCYWRRQDDYGPASIETSYFQEGEAR